MPFIKHECITLHCVFKVIMLVAKTQFTCFKKAMHCIKHIQMVLWNLAFRHNLCKGIHTTITGNRKLSWTTTFFLAYLLNSRNTFTTTTFMNDKWQFILNQSRLQLALQMLFSLKLFRLNSRSLPFTLLNRGGSISMEKTRQTFARSF